MSQATVVLPATQKRVDLFITDVKNEPPLLTGSCPAVGEEMEKERDGDYIYTLNLPAKLVAEAQRLVGQRTGVDVANHATHDHRRVTGEVVKLYASTPTSPYAS